MRQTSIWHLFHKQLFTVTRVSKAKDKQKSHSSWKYKKSLHSRAKPSIQKQVSFPVGSARVKPKKKNTRWYHVPILYNSINLNKILKTIHWNAAPTTSLHCVSQMAADTHYLSFDGEFNQKFQIGWHELLLL